MKYFIISILLFLINSFTLSSKASEESVAKTICAKGIEYYNEEKYPEALKYFINGMESAEKENDNRYYMMCTGYMSIIYNRFEDYESAIYYSNRGYTMAVRLKEIQIQNDFLVNLISYYCRTGDIDNVRKCYDKLLKHPEQDVSYQYFLLYSKARLLRYGGKKDLAIREHRVAFEFARQRRMGAMYQLYQLSEIGNIYVEMHQYPQAVAMGKKCLYLAMQNGNNDLRLNAFKMLADAYDGMGDNQDEAEYRKQYYALNESVYNMKQFFTMKNYLTKFEKRATNKHISSLNYIIISVSILVLILVVSIIFVVINNRHLHDAQKLLIRKNDELQHITTKSKELLKESLDSVNDDGETYDSHTETEGESPITLSAEQSKKILKRIISVFDNNETIFNPDFSLNMLAEMVDSNTKYVSMIINETYQKNFKTLLNEYRIREASKRLVDSEHYSQMTIQAIYEEVGYRNAVSFIRSFKKVMGMTPSVYQKLVKEDKQPR